MYKLLLNLVFIGFSLSPMAQQFSGQWKGSFVDKSTSRAGFSGEKCDYVLELEVEGKEISGSSYTYFTENGIKYYTICKVKGEYNFKSKYLEIKEVERTKTNNPAHILNCLQIHKLTYFKQGDVETIEGKWVPTQNQSKGCGFGNTILTRRTLVNQFPKAYAKAKSSASPEKNLVTKPPKTTPHTTTTSVSKNIQSKEINNLKNPAVVEDPILAKTEKPVEKTIESKSENSDYTSKLESRKNTILKTIEVESKIIKVALYDNGEIDGDSISLFFNGKLLLTNKKLTDKSISLTLPIDDENAINELVMYAENLGLIAPNTALMVVTDGPNRYEIRITSDLEKSGTIRIIRKTNKP